MSLRQISLIRDFYFFSRIVELSNYLVLTNSQITSPSVSGSSTNLSNSGLLFLLTNCRIIELFGAHQFFNYLPSVSGSSTNLSNLGFLSLLKKRYPEAEICFILNSELKEPVNESMREVCKHYNVKLVELHDIEKQNGHPSISGMKSICAQLLEAGL